MPIHIVNKIPNVNFVGVLKFCLTCYPIGQDKQLPNKRMDKNFQSVILSNQGNTFAIGKCLVISKPQSYFYQKMYITNRERGPE